MLIVEDTRYQPGRTKNIATPRYLAAEKRTRHGAGMRHAQAAFRLGRLAEALVVLEAMDNGEHLTWIELKIRTKMKQAYLLKHPIVKV